MSQTLSDLQIQRLKEIGEIVRGDWSGSVFDGRDVKRWIDSVLSGNALDNDESFQTALKSQEAEG